MRLRRQQPAPPAAPPGVLVYEHKPDRIEVLEWTGDNVDDVLAFAATSYSGFWYCDGTLYHGKGLAIAVERGEFITRWASGTVMVMRRDALDHSYTPVERNTPAGRIPIRGVR